MKNINITHYIVVLVFIAPGTISAQNLMLQMFGGAQYSEFQYIENYQPGYAVPFGVRICGGLKSIQIGGDFRSGTHVYAFEDPFVQGILRFREIHKERYTGGLLRISTANSGVFIRAGAGMLRVTKVLKLANGDLYESTKLPGTMQLNAGLGFAIRLFPVLNLTFEGDVSRNMRRQVDYAIIPDKDSDLFTNNVLGVNLGLAFVL